MAQDASVYTTIETMKDAKAYLKRIGWTITKKDGEYRVNVAGGKEATAYYTNDLRDALETAVYEAAHRQTPPTEEVNPSVKIASSTITAVGRAVENNEWIGAFSAMEAFALVVKAWSKESCVKALQWLDRDGVWSDEDRATDGMEPMNDYEAKNKVVEMTWKGATGTI